MWILTRFWPCNYEDTVCFTQLPQETLRDVAGLAREESLHRRLAAVQALCADVARGVDVLVVRRRWRLEGSPTGQLC
jgi:hypothetical protein